VLLLESPPVGDVPLNARDGLDIVLYDGYELGEDTRQCSLDEGVV